MIKALISYLFTYTIIGASVSEPHIDEFAANFLYIYLQVAELASLAQLLPPCSPTVRNPAPDSSLCRELLLPDCVRFSCCSRARLRHPLPLLLPVCLRFQLLLPDCARFSCCSPLASASAASPDRVRFGCYMCTPRLRPLQLLLPDCVRFNCCSPIASASTAARPIASASTAAPRLRPL